MFFFCEDVIVEIDIEICVGEIYIVGDEFFGEDGFYSVILIGVEGCDSIVILDLVVFDLVVVLFEVLIICFGDLVEFIVLMNYLIGLDGVVDQMSLILDVGIYDISVLDMVWGCLGEGMVIVFNDGGFVVSISGVIEICVGEEVFLMVLLDVIYFWEMGEIMGMIIIIEFGFYCVMVMDENNCEGIVCIDVLFDI